MVVNTSRSTSVDDAALIVALHGWHAGLDGELVQLRKALLCLWR